LEDEEENASTSQAFYIEGEDDIPDHIKTATAGVEKIWPKTEKLQQAVKTSSCGSCYAGDAFRYVLLLFFIPQELLLTVPLDQMRILSLPWNARVRTWTEG
jgi:hypothetical protein